MYRKRESRVQEEEGSDPCVPTHPPSLLPPLTQVWHFWCNAPINVKLLGGEGRPGTGGGFDVTSLPVVGTFDHLLSSFDQQ